MVATCAESPSERDISCVLEFWQGCEKGLADKGVISAGALAAVDFRELAQGTFSEKTGGDFPNVVGGGEGDDACWRNILAGLRQKRKNGLCHRADDEAVVADGEGGQAGGGVGFRPAVGELEG